MRVLSAHFARLPSPDAQLEEEVRRHGDERARLPVLSISRGRQPEADTLIRQLVTAEAEMQRFHEQDIRRHEEIAQTLMWKIEEMSQDDQRPTL